MNERIDNHSDEINSTMDEEEFGTQNTDYLHAEIVQDDPSDSENTLPDLELNIEENQDSDYYVTHFRAINETRKGTTKFERLNDSTSIDTDTE